MYLYHEIDKYLIILEFIMKTFEELLKSLQESFQTGDSLVGYRSGWKIIYKDHNKKTFILYNEKTQKLQIVPQGDLNNQDYFQKKKSI